MAEKVEVVITIPKYYLERPQDYNCLAECVRRGTPLPKGHGRLGDLDELAHKMVRADIYNLEGSPEAVVGPEAVAGLMLWLCHKEDTIIEADTIIEESTDEESEGN